MLRFSQSLQKIDKENGHLPRGLEPFSADGAVAEEFVFAAHMLVFPFDSQADVARRAVVRVDVEATAVSAQFAVRTMVE